MACGRSLGGLGRGGVGGVGSLGRSVGCGASVLGRRSGVAGCGRSLVLQRLGQPGDLGQRRLEQAGSPGRQRLEHAGDLGQQHLAGLQVGDLVDLGRAERLAVEHAALDHQQRVGLGEVTQALGRRDRVALDERDGGGPDQQAVVDADTGLGRGPPGQGVLDHRVGGVGTERLAQLGDLLDGEPAVLGDHRRRRLVEALDDLGDRAGFSLFGMSLLSCTSAPASPERHAADPARRTRNAPAQGARGGQKSTTGPSCAGRSGAPELFGRMCARDNQRSSGGSVIDATD